MTTLHRLFNSIKSDNIKIIALVAMTIDHIATAFSGVLPYGVAYIMHIIGRIAAPLFMYCLIIGMRYTKNRKKYFIRLYSSNLIIAFVWIPFAAMQSAPQVISTYLYVFLYSVIAESVIRSIKDKKLLSAIKNLLIIVSITIIPVLLDKTVFENISHAVFSTMGIEASAPLRTILRALIPNIWSIDYTLFFVLMGVMWYFSKNKYIVSGILVLFSVISYLGTYKLGVDSFISFFSVNQFFMILAAPIIMLHNENDRHNKSAFSKYFFYIYYPTHYMLLMAVSNCCML